MQINTLRFRGSRAVAWACWSRFRQHVLFWPAGISQSRVCPARVELQRRNQALGICFQNWKGTFSALHQAPPMSVKMDFSEVRSCVLDWTAAKPSGRISIVEEPLSGGARIACSPISAPSACPFSLVVKNGSMQWHVGRAIVFDEVDGLYARGSLRLTSEMTSLQLAALLDALWDGEVSETIWEHRGKVIASRGSITVRGTAFRIARHRRLSILFVKADKKRDCSYENY